MKFNKIGKTAYISIVVIIMLFTNIGIVFAQTEKDATIKIRTKAKDKILFILHIFL